MSEVVYGKYCSCSVHILSVLIFSSTPFNCCVDHIRNLHCMPPMLSFRKKLNYNTN